MAITPIRNLEEFVFFSEEEKQNLKPGTNYNGLTIIEKVSFNDQSEEPIYRVKCSCGLTFLKNIDYVLENPFHCKRCERFHYHGNTHSPENLMKKSLDKRNKIKLTEEEEKELLHNCKDKKYLHMAKDYNLTDNELKIILQSRWIQN